MNAFLYPLMVFSACGFALSVGAHILSLAGVTIPGGKLVWILHIGIFIVWIPVVLISNRTMGFTRRKDFWKVALAGCPDWMRTAGYVLLAYTVLNFILFMATVTHQPKPPAGDAPPSVVRGFSGHWMFFYGAAFAMLYSRIHAPHLYRPRKCPQGHDVSPTARFCPECGYRFPDELGNA